MSENTDSQSVPVYDFRRPNRISKDRFRTIQTIFDRVVNPLGLVFQQRLRAKTAMTLSSLEQMTFGEYTAQLASPCSAFIYNMGGEGEPSALIDFGQELPFQVIERLFGGNGEKYDLDRPLTLTEIKTFGEQIVDRMMKVLAETWQEHMTFHPVFKEFEFAPEVLEVALRDDPVLIAVFRIEVQEIQTTFSFCLPIAALDSFLSGGGGGRQSALPRSRVRASGADRQAIERHIREAQVDLVARLPVFRLPAGEAALLKPGVLVHSGVPVQSDFEVVAGLRAHFRGTPETAGSSIAIRITEALISADEALVRFPRGKVIAEEADTEAPVVTLVTGPRPPAGGGPLGHLRDLMLPVAVEIGRSRVRVDQMRKMKIGDSIDLDRFAGEPCDLYIEDKLFGLAEILHIGDHIGLRVLSVIGETPDVPEETEGGTEHLDDLELVASVDAGSATMLVRQILKLGRGSMIELDSPLDAAFPLRVGDRFFAETEVVQIGELFGVRVGRTIEKEKRKPVADMDLLLNGESATFEELGDLAPLHDLALELTAIIGSQRMTLASILALNEGDTFVLDRFAGEPCDLYISGRRFAEGEIAPMGDNRGIKIINLVPSGASMSPPNTEPEGHDGD